RNRTHKWSGLGIIPATVSSAVAAKGTGGTPIVILGNDPCRLGIRMIAEISHPFADKIRATKRMQGWQRIIILPGSFKRVCTAFTRDAKRLLDLFVIRFQIIISHRPVGESSAVRNRIFAIVLNGGRSDF